MNRVLHFLPCLNLQVWNSCPRVPRALWLVGILASAATARAAEIRVLAVPGCAHPLTVAADLAEPAEGPADGWELAEIGGKTRTDVQLAPRLDADGTVVAGQGQTLALIPPAADEPAMRQFQLQRRAEGAAPPVARFRLETVDDKTLRVLEQDKPVIAYNYGTITGEHVPEHDRRRYRACYVHPIWGLHGEVLTDDFPKDHYHHHGAFWAWPHVTVDGTRYDLWTNAGIEQRFVRWLHQEAGPVAAVIGVENGWFVGDRQVATERVWMRIYRAGARERSLDLEIYLIPLVPLSLQGADGKSYGGLTVRFAVQRRADVTITVPAGATSEDLLETPLEWADLTTQFPGAPDRSGGAVFVHPQHPNFPPTWLTRHYGPLCVGWPGVHARQYEPGQPHRLPYRIWVHAGAADVEQLRTQYAAFTAGTQARWGTAPQPADRDP